MRRGNNILGGIIGDHVAKVASSTYVVNSGPMMNVIDLFPCLRQRFEAMNVNRPFALSAMPLR